METSRLSTEVDSMVEASSPQSPNDDSSSPFHEEEHLDHSPSKSSSPTNNNNNRNSTSLPFLHIASPSAPLNLIYSCGKNKYGILGNLDDFSEKSVPTATPINKNSSHHSIENPSFNPLMIKQVEAGAYHLAILTEFGEVYVSGYNSFKEAMKTNQSSLSQMQKLHFDKKVKAISSGWFHLMLLTNEGDLFSSGLNSNGQLGLGDLAKREDFEKVNIPKYKVNTSTSDEEECSSSGSGSSNEDNVVENSIEDGKEEIIDSYELNIPIKRLCCGEHHSAFITNNGALYVAGKNNCGELGIGRKTSKPNVSYFTLVQAGFLAQDICFGKDHSVLLSQDGQIYVSGSNEAGQIGLGNVKSVKKFVKINMVRPGFKITKISCGFVHSMAITNTGGYMIGSGGNINGELGLSDRVKKPQFAMLKTNLIPKHVSCGASLSVFLTDQNAYSCGINTDGRLGTGDTNQYSAVFKKVSSLNTDVINRVETAAFSSHFYFSHRKAILDSLPTLHFPIRHYNRDRIHDKVYGYVPLLRKVIPKFYESVISNESYLNSLSHGGLTFAQYLIDCIQGHFVHTKEKIADHLVDLTPIEKVNALHVMNHVDTDIIIENFRRFVMNLLIEEIDGKEQTNQVADEVRMLLDNFKDLNENIQDTPLEKVSRVVHSKKPFSHYINHPIHEQSNHKHIFHKMFNDPATSDVKVIIDAEKKHVLYLHKTLLSSYSPLFEKIFDEQFQFSKDDNSLDLFDFDQDSRSSIDASDSKIKEKALFHLLGACYGITKQKDAEDDSFVLLNSEITILIGMIYHANLFQMDSVIQIYLTRKLANLLSVDNFLDICKWMLMFGDESLFQQQRIPSSSPIFEPEILPPIHEIFNLLTQFAEMNLKPLSKMYEGKLSEWDAIPHIKQMLTKKTVTKPTKKSSKGCSIQ